MNIDNQNIPDNNKNPWKGLNFYTEEDKDNFFGRDEEIHATLVELSHIFPMSITGEEGGHEHEIKRRSRWRLASALDLVE